MQVTGDGQRVTVQQSRDFAFSHTVQCGVVQCRPAWVSVPPCTRYQLLYRRYWFSYSISYSILGQILDMDIC